MPKSRKLPCQEPFTSAWPDINFLHSIVQNVPQGIEWILNSHIQMRASVYRNNRWGIGDARITFYPYAVHDLTPNLYDQCPFLDKYSVPRGMICDAYESFADYVRYMIDRDYYLSLYVDQFFRDDIAGEGYHHPIYIYGYDDAINSAFCFDNFERGKYTSKTISYDVLQKAYDLIHPEPWESSVFLYRLKDHSYRFVPQFVADQLEDYLHPGRGICYFDKMICPEKIHDGKDYYNAVYFGMECYDFLKQFIVLLLQGKSFDFAYDIRSFCMVADHKILMVKRYQYMVAEGYIDSSGKVRRMLEKQLENAHIMMNLFLKFSITGKERILLQILDLLDDFVEEEKQAVAEFLKLIPRECDENSVEGEEDMA